LLEIEIPEPTVAYSAPDKLWTLRCDVWGSPVTMSSRTQLIPNIDAPVCALFLQALDAGCQLAPAAPVDATLTANLGQVARIAKKYWGFGGPLPKSTPVKRQAGGKPGMFFSCGVDSFYTLRRNLGSVHHLINVHGFDIRLSDKDRYSRSLIGLRQVAEQLELDLITVQTDLRSHAAFNRLSWELTHVAALSAVAHALGGVLSDARLASSDVPPPWGSHPDLDKLWSSGATTITNDEHDIRRIDKVREIADWPLAQKNLRVCWENRAPTLNCGECEKCVRTQAALFAFDALDKFVVFPPGDLADRIGSLLYVASKDMHLWQGMRAAIDNRRVRKAIDMLLVRSRVLNPAKKALKHIGISRAMLKKVSWPRNRS